MRTPFFIVIMLFAGVLAAQPLDFKRDYVWPIAYQSNTPPFDDFPFVRLDFNADSLTISSFEVGIEFSSANSNISTEDGVLLWHTNGVAIANRFGNIINNGDSLCYNPYCYNYTFTSSQAITVPQMALALPMPGNPYFSYLFHQELSFTGISPTYYATLALYLTTINMEPITGLGIVTEKSEIIFSDTLEWGKLTACRHANGRDWWVIIPKFNSGMYYVFLLSPDGVNQYPTIEADYIPAGVGTACFTSDGTKYVRLSSNQAGSPSKLRVYEFDRCSGTFGAEKNANIPGNYNVQSISISPNSQFVYVAHGDSISQFDLSVSSLQASRQTVAYYDGFVSPFFGTYFNIMQLAPDGKIYIETGNTTDCLHVINKPDKEGEACEVLQHSIILPTLNASIPNFPHYRMGPLDGSPCDTLGLDNLPVAGWRHDTLPPLTVEFTDNSYYNVTDWIWKFGDGGTDTVEHPVHSYTAPGLYWVCQIVSNENAADTLCKWVQVGEVQDTIPTEPPTGWATDTAVALQPDRETITHTTQADHSQGIRVYPNPARDFVFLHSTPPLPPLREGGSYMVRVTDMMGREVLRQPLAAMVSTLDVRSWASGVYFYSIQKEGREMQSGKLIKL